MGSGESAAFLAAAPRTHRRFIDDSALTTLDDGAVRRGGPPKSLKTHHSRSLFNFDSSVFPDSPEHKKALQGLRTASCVVGFLRDLGFNSEKVHLLDGSNSGGDLVLMAFTVIVSENLHARGRGHQRSVT